MIAKQNFYYFWIAAILNQLCNCIKLMTEIGFCKALINVVVSMLYEHSKYFDVTFIKLFMKREINLVV